MTNSIDVLEGQLRECYGRVVYSHKTHEKQADLLIKRQSCIKKWQIAISAFVTGGIMAALLMTDGFKVCDTVIFNKQGATIISAILSTVQFALNAYAKEYDLGAIAQKHRQTGADLWIIRERYLSLLTDIRVGDVTLESVRVRRDELEKCLQGVYAGAPSTTYDAYQNAQKALKESEDMTFSDDEIDKFLPRELKKNPSAGQVD